ncbi:hypothetical protein OSTOST_01824, partial [Ostertagia ostertagi]
MPFYDGPLHQESYVNGTILPGGGGCPREYEWCSHTPRVPKGLYLFNAAILLGLCFPLVSAPCNTLLSEILGPRKQVCAWTSLTAKLTQVKMNICMIYKNCIAGLTRTSIISLHIFRCEKDQHHWIFYF